MRRWVLFFGFFFSDLTFQKGWGFRLGCFFADLIFLQKYKMVFWKLYVGFSVFNCFGFYYYSCLTRKMPEMAPEGPRADFGLRPLKVAKQNCIVATILESPAMLEMASGGPSGRSRPPAIESIKAKVYWSDHFGEPRNAGNGFRRAPGPILASGH